MYYGLSAGTNPNDSLALYAADNPFGPARKLLTIKPIDTPPPIGGVTLSIRHTTFPDSACYYYWLDHGPGYFPAVRDPWALDLRPIADPPICYTWWPSQDWGPRPQLDPPNMVEVTDPGLNAGHVLNIAWELSTDDNLVDFYNVYRAVSSPEAGEDYHWITSVPGGASNFSDHDVNGGVTYSYMVSAAHHGYHGGTGGANQGIWNDFSEPLEGTPINDFPIIRAAVLPHGSTELVDMPERTAVGCPKGDWDKIVIEVRLDPAVFGDVSAGSFLLSQPANHLVVFVPSSSPIAADSNVAILSPDTEFLDGCARTTFTVGAFGGSGVDSSLISVNGAPLGYAHLNVKSYDFDTSGMSLGIVNLSDYAVFGNAYTSTPCRCLPGYPKQYDARADYALPDTTISLTDLSQFGPHYSHQVPGGGGGSLVAGQISAGSIELELEEVLPLIGEHKLRATVKLEGVEAFEVAVFALRNENPKLEFIGWSEAAGFGGETMCAEIVRDGRHECFIGVLGQEGGSSGTTTLGVAEFRVLSDQELPLTDEDLAMVTADLLPSAGGTTTRRGVDRCATVHRAGRLQECTRAELS